MDKILKIAEIISTDIRSRANANIIKSIIDGFSGNIVLDFEHVTFMSRSFTDELYNVISENKNVSLTNMDDFIASMYDTVTEGRKNKRIYESKSAEIKECNDMKSLSCILASIY